MNTLITTRLHSPKLSSLSYTKWSCSQRWHIPTQCDLKMQAVFLGRHIQFRCCYCVIIHFKTSWEWLMGCMNREEGVQTSGSLLLFTAPAWAVDAFLWISFSPSAEGRQWFQLTPLSCSKILPVRRNRWTKCQVIALTPELHERPASWLSCLHSSVAIQDRLLNYAKPLSEPGLIKF